ncbi:MAG: class I SAM-dependent methyltransferase [Acidobacteriota bacterium]
MPIKDSKAQVLGNLDRPNAKEIQIGESNNFSGWVLVSDGAAIKRIEVLCEGEVIGVCDYGLQRDDVLSAYSHREDAKYSGFLGNIYVPENLLAPLQFIVVDSLGRRHQFVSLNNHLTSQVFRHQLFTGSAIITRTIYPDINTKVHPKCEMYKYAKSRLRSDLKAAEYYFHSAEFLIKNMQKFFDETGVAPKEKSILDFASGYGRFARYFAKMFNKVTASDLEQEMLDFNKREFGAEVFLSSPEGAAILRKHEDKYDVVFCFSLFSHLNEQLWMEWFKNLFELVTNGGYLIISTHGQRLFKRMFPERAIEWEEKKTDFYFVKGNETGGRLDKNIYGMAVVTDDFVRRTISDIKGIRIVRKYEMGDFDQYQDIYIFQKAS